MSDLFAELMKKTGQTCYTLVQNKPAQMDVNDQGVTVTYPSGMEVFLPASMVREAIYRLQTKGDVDVDEIHAEVTHQNKTRTDKLMAVLREVPGVTFTPYPKRILHYQTKKI